MSRSHIITFQDGSQAVFSDAERGFDLAAKLKSLHPGKVTGDDWSLEFHDVADHTSYEDTGMGPLDPDEDILK